MRLYQCLEKVSCYFKGKNPTWFNPGDVLKNLKTNKEVLATHFPYYGSCFYNETRVSCYHPYNYELSNK